ncbi:MAG: TIGR03960 family B12-binding radical SAM protein [Thermodesulfobacteriota bacterium]
MKPDHFLPLVRKPGRYSGNEFNVVRKAWESAALRIVLSFPDLYEIGMSHQGVQILYHLLNSRADLLAERVYAPDSDLEALLRENRAPLFSLESQRPVADFDMLGITLPYELCYTNILTILACSGLPFYARERNESHPLVLGGGPCAFHAEPVADFFDAILLGDGEEAVLEIADCLLRGKREQWDRGRQLGALADIPGVYVPSFFAPRYDDNKDFAGITPLRPGYERVRRRILPSLEYGAFHPPLVPLFKIVHDRLGIEVARGCTRGCRFCQAGIIYRPVRERSRENILEIARAGIACTGFEELALLSLSTGDYSCIAPLLTDLMDALAEQKVSLSMPSMRVGTLTPEIMEQIRRVRKTGFTLAPEAGTERLRRVINKGITEEDLLATCKAAFALGWKLIKFYFMFGLPGESEEDRLAIIDLARRALAQSHSRATNITVSVSTFVPKPHTPFQWEEQIGMQQGFAHINSLRKHLRDRRIQLRWGDPRQSFLEGVMSRGDRRLGPVIIEAWRRGARLDAWSDHMKIETWQTAAAAVEVDLDRYLRPRAFTEPLPWDHLDVGLAPDFLRRELEKGLAEGYTPDCRYHGCQKCGLCDFKTIQPIVGCKKGAAAPAAPAARSPRPASRPTAQALRLLYRFNYQRIERARFISHLELLQLFFRSFRRAGLPLNFSQGFNPTPRVSFSPALPLGTESLAEYLLVDLHAPLANVDLWREKLNRQLPGGLAITAITSCREKNMPDTVESVYVIDIPGPPRELAALDAFLAAEAYPIAVTRKKAARTVDVRPLVPSLRLLDDGRIELVLVSATGRAGLKPLEIIAAIFSLTTSDLHAARVLKVAERDVSHGN